MWDIIVVGLGAVGAAAMRAAAEKGARVLGLDLDHPAHSRGSSHGYGRIFRHAYYEHPDYVPLLQHATRRFESLERATGRSLLHRCGVLMLGGPKSIVVARSLEAASVHRLSVEHLDHNAIEKRFPWFTHAASATCDSRFTLTMTQGVFEANAGVVRPEEVIAAALEFAQSQGAEIRLVTRVSAIHDECDFVTVVTPDIRLQARQVIVAAGAWTSKLLPELSSHLRVTRQIQTWVIPKAPELRADCAMPCLFIDRGTNIPALYGLPADPESSDTPARYPKVAFHGSDIVVDPDIGAAPATAEELDAILGAYLQAAPSLVGSVSTASTCLYTMSPDEHAIIGKSRRSSRIHFVAGLSGHGFKLSPALGDAVVDLALDGRTALPIELLHYSRLT